MIIGRLILLIAVLLLLVMPWSMSDTAALILAFVVPVTALAAFVLTAPLDGNQAAIQFWRIQTGVSAVLVLNAWIACAIRLREA